MVINMKIGILGGSFNPPHLAHIGMASNCISEFNLDEAVLVVAADPPHKAIAEHVSAKRRYDMTVMSACGVDKLSVSDVELKREGKSYTIDTIKAFEKQYAGAELYLIVGADMLADLPTWYKADEILKRVSVIAVGREGLEVKAPKALLEDEYGVKVFLSNYDSRGISSSMVRERVRDALPLNDYVCTEVELMIYENTLYWPDELKAIAHKLCQELDQKRYKHTMGTVKSAIELANRYNVDREKARLAALLHDCARRKEKNDLIALARTYGFDTPQDVIPGLIHAPLGAIHAKESYGVSDEQVLDAIGCHTLLRMDMTDLDKIIYLADKTEPNRDYCGVDAIRRDIQKSGSLNEAVLACIDGVYLYEKTKKTFDSRILAIRESIAELIKNNGGRNWKQKKCKKSLP